MLPDSEQGCNSGTDHVMSGKSVAPHDVELDELCPALAAFDAGLSCKTGSSDFRRVSCEVLRADPGAAPDQGAFPDLSRSYAQDQG